MYMMLRCHLHMVLTNINNIEGWGRASRGYPTTISPSVPDVVGATLDFLKDILINLVTLYGPAMFIRRMPPSDSSQIPH